MVGQPEEAKGHYDDQDEILTPDPSTELGLPQATQDAHIAGQYDGVGDHEAHHCFERVV